MNARTLTTVSALMLAGSGAIANADEAGIQLAWQQPGYVEEVVVATAPRPERAPGTESAADTTLAWQQPGYVEEVVVVSTSRREVLAAALPRMLARLESRALMGLAKE